MSSLFLVAIIHTHIHSQSPWCTGMSVCREEPGWLLKCFFFSCVSMWIWCSREISLQPDVLASLPFSSSAHSSVDILEQTTSSSRDAFGNLILTSKLTIYTNYKYNQLSLIHRKNLMVNVNSHINTTQEQCKLMNSRHTTFLKKRHAEPFLKKVVCHIKFTWSHIDQQETAAFKSDSLKVTWTLDYGFYTCMYRDEREPAQVENQANS